MTELFNYLLTFLRDFDQLICELCKPNPKFLQDKIEYKITHRRNRVLLKIMLLLLVVFILDMSAGTISLSVSLLRCIILIILGLGLIFSCHYHPCVFAIANTIILLIYGHFIVNSSEGGIHRAWLLAYIFPLYLYVFTANWWWFLFQAVAQIVLINSFYSKLMEKALTEMSPQAFSKALTYATNITLVLNTILLSCLHYFMQHAYKRISIVEKKKDEIENQKIFLLGFSHELRNLINSLTGNVTLATLEILAPKARELLLNAQVCGELLLHLVNNILDTGKVEIGELEINPVPTRIYDTLERIWGICSELIKRKNLLGKLSIQKNLPKKLMIDHYRLTQIFLNLVGNAVKFTETGSIDISIEWLSQSEGVDEDCFQPYPFNYFDDHDEGLFEKQRVLSSLDKNILTLDLYSRKINYNMLKQQVHAKKGVLKIVVSDTGCGMSEEEAKKIFSKFTQVSSDSSKRKLGTGLGLFITKQLCHRMQGEIKVFSQKGSGSAFIFCIPVDVVQDYQEHLQDIESLKSFLKSKSLEAMIVDDAPFNHAVLKSFFDKIGVKVAQIANNGLEAYHKYYQQIQIRKQPHIVTMDLDMPIMDGKESARRIRRLEEQMKITPCFLVIISANCSESEIAECLDKLGQIRADRFIKKPASIEELLEALGHHFVSGR